MQNEEIGSLAMAPNTRIRMDAWGARLVSILTGFMGAVNFLSAIRPTWMTRLATFENALPLDLHDGNRLTTALAGFGLFLLAGSLWRRKQAGWLLTMVLAAISATIHLIKGPGYAAGLATGFLLLLLLLVGSFSCRSDTASVQWGAATLASVIFITLVCGTAGFTLEGVQTHQNVNFPGAIGRTIMIMASFYNPGLQLVNGFGRYFADSIYYIWIATLGFVLFMILRPVVIRHPATAGERKQARGIVEKFGHTALARPALFDDKSYFFSRGGSVVAFAARGRFAVALGDPIGPPKDIAAAILEYKGYCFKNDWQAAFVFVPPDSLGAYRAAGFDTICVGNEAIVPLSTMTFEGVRYRNIRWRTSLMSRLGYTVKVHPPPIDDRLLAELKKISDAWLTLKPGSELQFFNGLFDHDYILNGPVAVVHAPDGHPTAFVNLMPEYQKNEVTFDLMRRHPEAVVGTMDFLFASILMWTKGQGYESVSLGTSTFVGVGEKPDDPRMERMMHTVSDHLDRFYNFKSLHFYKNKFHPRWEPRYLVFPGKASLPFVFITLSRIHTKDSPFQQLIRAIFLPDIWR